MALPDPMLPAGVSDSDEAFNLPSGRVVKGHKLIIHDEATGRSTCSCSRWAYEVKNFRPSWPMDKDDVRIQVHGAFESHLNFQQTGRVAA